jgi:hypothetical protein
MFRSLLPDARVFALHAMVPTRPSCPESSRTIFEAATSQIWMEPLLQPTDSWWLEEAAHAMEVTMPSAP